MTQDTRTAGGAVTSPTSEPGTALARWMNLYDQLVDARARLKAADTAEGVLVPDELVDDVRRLQRLAGVALDIVANEQKIQRGMSACMRGRA